MIIANNGTGTFQSNTLEGQLLEAIVLHSKLQKSSANNPNNFKYVSYSITDSGNTLSAQFEFPATQGFGSDGSPTFSAKEYLVNTLFVKSSSELQSTTLTRYLVELLFKAQLAEDDPTKNPTSLNQVTAGFPVDSNVFSGSCTLGLTESFNADGHPTFPVKPYLA